MMMNTPEHIKSDEKPEFDSKIHQTSPKRSSRGIVLIPQPTDDPHDPLNWSPRRKLLILFIVTAAAFSGYAQTVANQSGYFRQADVYGTTAVRLSYSGSAGVVGLATGPLIWQPLSYKYGRSSCILWGMIGCLACGVWSTCMTGRSRFVPFVISRWLGSTFGCVATTLGGGTVFDIYFLHQRGKAFNGYVITFLLAINISPSISGFIVDRAPWPIQYWWTVGVEGFVIILTFCFLEETGYDRSRKVRYPHPPQSWAANRVATFFPGNKVVPAIGSSELKQRIATLFLMGISPVTLCIGIFVLIAFGFVVGVSIVLSIFLEGSLPEGYGFTPTRFGLFNIVSWISCIASEICGHFLNDRLPLWIARRRGGVWQPEFRLYSLIVPVGIILPIGLGLFGASLQYHLHYMVLALAILLTFLGGLSIPSIAVNYIAECFTERPIEAATIMNFYRLVFGLVIPFFIAEWQVKVGPGWAFGMMAFFTLLAFIFPVILMWKGESIRRLSFSSIVSSEAGVSLVNDSDTKGKRGTLVA